MNGIVTEEILLVNDGNNKSYQVNCTSKHATAFAVVAAISDVTVTTEAVATEAVSANECK